MASAGALTREAALRKLIARIGAPFIDATGDFDADGSGECSATWARMISSAHTAGVICDFDAQAVRHLATGAQQLMR